ncbi:RICIN domain-containing protein [Marinicellulosiphila megalodicopiae]|uniref:RICIN domain-containing protein n=1 Tax=Marinicellulosiphila megalodicopiae TaxID=2724896 RepID=UPI003BB1F610
MKIQALLATPIMFAAVATSCIQSSPTTVDNTSTQSNIDVVSTSTQTDTVQTTQTQSDTQSETATVTNTQSNTDTQTTPNDTATQTTEDNTNSETTNSQTATATVTQTETTNTDVGTVTESQTQTQTQTDVVVDDFVAVSVLDESNLYACFYDHLIEDASVHGRDALNSPNEMGASFTWQVELEDVDSIKVEVVYANGSTEARPGLINFAGLSASLNFDPVTGSSTDLWANWTAQTVEFNQSMDSGVYAFTITGLGDLGLPNIDQIILSTNNGHAVISQTGLVCEYAYCLDEPAAGNDYSLINAQTGLSWDVASVSTAVGANIVSYDFVDGANQKFNVEVDGQIYQFKATHSNLPVGVRDDSKINAAQLEQSDDSYGFYIQRDHANQPYRLIAAHSGKTVGIASTDSVAAVLQQTEAQTQTQRWFFNPVGGGCNVGVNSLELADVQINSAVPALVPVVYTYVDPANHSCADLPQSGMYYHIENASTQKSFDIPAAGSTIGTGIQLWGYGSGDHQTFLFEEVGDNEWVISPKHAQLNLGITGTSSDQYAYAELNNTMTRWVVKQNDTGGPSKLVAKHSGFVLTSDGGDNGAPIYQALDVDSNAQRWFFNPAFTNCNTVGTNKPAQYDLPNDPNAATSEKMGMAFISGNDGLSTTTGGAGGQTVTVTSCSDLVNYAKSSSAYVIQIPANTSIDCRTSARALNACRVQCPSYNQPEKSYLRVPVGDQVCTELGSSNNNLEQTSQNETRINVASNKTIIGLGNSKIYGASFNVSNQKNVIFKNFAIEDINPHLVEAGDGITANDSSHVWIDHVSFKLISDGHVDMNGSRNITLSWNEFDGYNTFICGDQHHYTNLVQNTHATFHNNFYNQTSGRNPKITGSEARAHLFNNYWYNITYFAAGVSKGAQAKMENNYFDNTRHPHWLEDTGQGSAMDAGNPSTNVYTGISANAASQDGASAVHTGDNVLSGIDLGFYMLQPAANLNSTIISGAGAQ